MRRLYSMSAGVSPSTITLYCTFFYNKGRNSTPAYCFHMNIAHLKEHHKSFGCITVYNISCVYLMFTIRVRVHCIFHYRFSLWTYICVPCLYPWTPLSHTPETAHTTTGRVLIQTCREPYTYLSFSDGFYAKVSIAAHILHNIFATTS